MPRYQKRFELDPDDIELIERALRNEPARHPPFRGERTRGDGGGRNRARAINAVLATIHDQKFFYAQVKLPEVPAD